MEISQCWVPAISPDIQVFAMMVLMMLTEIGIAINSLEEKSVLLLRGSLLSY